MSTPLYSKITPKSKNCLKYALAQSVLQPEYGLGNCEKIVLMPAAEREFYLLPKRLVTHWGPPGPFINLLNPTGHVLHQKVNIAVTVRCAHTVFMCFVFIWEQTATCATYSINWLVFMTAMKSVYSAVRTGSLNKSVCISSLKVNIAATVRPAHTVFMCFVFIWEQTATCATYSINWLVFTTEMKSVYSAVRTGSLNKAVCGSSVKG